jgi:hypothetical protein
MHNPALIVEHALLKHLLSMPEYGRESLDLNPSLLLVVDLDSIMGWKELRMNNT